MTNLEDSYIDAFLRVGTCNKILKNNTILLINDYVKNYLNCQRLSIGKDLKFFRFNVIKFGGYYNSWQQETHKKK